MHFRRQLLAVLPLCLLVVACGGGGGGGSGGGTSAGTTGPGGSGGGGFAPATKADQQVTSFSTIVNPSIVGGGPSDGSWAQVDITPVFAGTPGHPIGGLSPAQAAAPDPFHTFFLNEIQRTDSTDLDADWGTPMGPAGATVPTTGFEAYATGLDPGTLSGFTLAANNVYDMFQTSTGRPDLTTLTAPPTGLTFQGYTGGDLDSAIAGGDTASEGGPGLYANLAGTGSPLALPPPQPFLPNTMGTPGPGVSGRGPSTTDEHQFVQIVFPYSIVSTSILSPTAVGNNFMGSNVIVTAKAVQDTLADMLNVTDLDVPIGFVPIVGGVAGIPTVPGGGTFTTIDPDPTSPTFSFIPTGAQEHIMKPNVLTLIAHEAPSTISSLSTIGDIGTITLGGILRLPNPDSDLLPVSPGGGRVFGSNAAVPGSVNDFATSGDTTAAAIGFFSVEITSVVASDSETVLKPYFHTFPIDQSNVLGDPRAVGLRGESNATSSTPNATFNRGPAVRVDPITGIMGIDIASATSDAINSSTYVSTFSPGSVTAPGGNAISTRAKFRIKFDKQVVPNSVGFSRRHTIHSSGFLGTVFPFNGNTLPITSAANEFTGGLGSPLAPSIFVAVNQRAGVNQATGFVQPVNSLFQVKGVPSVTAGTFLADDGVTTFPVTANGLTPAIHNGAAMLPRGIVPVDIYPVNQNNLQEYIVETLVEMPPGMAVTVGVAMPGLGMSALGVTNRGNHTRSGTMFTPFQGLDATGLGTDASQKQAVLANNSVIKVNAGPMDLQGMLFFGGTNIANHRLVNGDLLGSDDITEGGYNVCRTFVTGFDNDKLYVNAPVSPQAIYLAYTTGGAGVLDLSGTGYTTNAPLGSLANTGMERYLTVSRFLPATTLSGSTSNFNWTSNGAFAAGDHFRGFGIIGRYTSGTGKIAGNVESDHAVGAAISMGFETPQPGINEGSSGYESLVSSGITRGTASTATKVLAPTASVGIVRDMEIGDFLDAIYFDTDNTFAQKDQHRSYNTPLLGTISTNSIADPPVPNPPPLRFPVGLNITNVKFDQTDLLKPPSLISGNEVFTADGFMIFDDGSGFSLTQQQPNVHIQLNPTGNTSNGTSKDRPHLPNFGFSNPFGFFGGGGAAGVPQFVQTGPMPKTSTAGAVILAGLNSFAAGTFDSGGLRAPIYQSRQQIGNFLFAADGVNKKVHALNSNTMEVIESISLPDPFGLGLTADLSKLFVSNEGDNSVSIIDADPKSLTFMTEIKRTKVGVGPRAVAANGDGEDVIVLNFLGNTISILDITAGNVRKTISSNGIDRPYDVAVGMRESVGGPAFQSGTYHAYITNFGGTDTTLDPSVLVFESGPDGPAGIGADTILGSVTSADTSLGFPLKKILAPRGVSFDPVAPKDGFGLTVGCFVAHTDEDGNAAVTRISYFKDSFPGEQPSGGFGGVFGVFGGKIFEVRTQYISTFPGPAFDVALPDFNRDRLEKEDFGTFYNLFNSGATPKTLPIIERNSKYPLTDNFLPTTFDGPRWEPDRLYVSISGKIIDVFLLTGQHVKTITTPSDVGVLTTYFSQ